MSFSTSKCRFLQLIRTNSYNALDVLHTSISVYAVGLKRQCHGIFERGCCMNRTSHCPDVLGFTSLIEQKNLYLTRRISQTVQNSQKLGISKTESRKPRVPVLLIYFLQPEHVTVRGREEFFPYPNWPIVPAFYRVLQIVN